MLLQIFLSTLKETIGITGLVMLIMIIIEGINVESGGVLFKKLKGTRFGQILVSALLGAIPGCAGGFASVSLYNHRMISFGALTAMMIATAGDESFLMIAMFPKKAGILFAILFTLAILSGILTDFLAGLSEKRHTGLMKSIKFNETDNFEVHNCDCRKDGRHHGLRHFISEHIWGHVIKKHLPKIFAWTFGVLFIFGILAHYVDMNRWISDNSILTLLIAIGIGLIPASGPHMVFVTLFAGGLIPFPILLANSIVQEGHAGIPLLADNKKSFIYAKAIKVVLALIIGLAALLI